MAGYLTRDPVPTNLVTAVVPKLVLVLYAKVVQVPVPNLVAKPEALATI